MAAGFIYNPFDEDNTYDVDGELLNVIYKVMVYLSQHGKRETMSIAKYLLTQMILLLKVEDKSKWNEQEFVDMLKDNGLRLE
tara:strand:- start:2454 stop:2699 length:246 start_codon:yes stop_codon:yes gene_type:complete